MFEVSESILRLWPSSASAKKSRSGIQKSSLKRRLSVRRLALELGGPRRIVPDLARQAGGAPLGVVGVALQLAGGAGRVGQSSVGEGDRVPGVLPALVFEPVGIAPLVFDVAVAVAIAVVVDPVHRGARLGLQSAHQLAVARPALVFLQQDQEQRRGVGGAVVGRVRRVLEGGHLAEAQLVRDLAGLRVAEGVVSAGLEQGQRPQRRGRQLGHERQRLEAGDQAVATEDGHEPGQARRGQRAEDDGRAEAQRRQIDQAALDRSARSGSQLVDSFGAASSHWRRSSVRSGRRPSASINGACGAGDEVSYWRAATHPGRCSRSPGVR